MIEDWKHGPHQLTYRQTERTFGLVAGALGKDEPGRAALAGRCSASATTCSRHPSRSEFKDASTVAGRGLDRPGILLPAPAATGPATAPTPKPPGDTARTTCCAAKTSCSSATTSPPRS